MPRERLYLETSVWNFILAEDAPERRAATIRFFELVEQGDWETSISALVLDEVLATPDEAHREKLVSLIGNVRPRELPISLEVLALADKYVLQGTLTSRHVADARHVAAAVVGGQDVVVSWNLRHIVKVKTRREVNAVNVLNGYRTIEIATPEELI